MLLVATNKKRQQNDSILGIEGFGVSVCCFERVITGGRCQAGKWSSAIARLSKMTSNLGRSGGSSPRSVATQHKGARRPAMVTLYSDTDDPGVYVAPWRAPSRSSETS